MGKIYSPSSCSHSLITPFLSSFSISESIAFSFSELKLGLIGILSIFGFVIKGILAPLIF